MKLTRRNFIQTLIAFSGSFLSSKNLYASQNKLEIETSGYPKTFAFRQSEALVNVLSYEEWETYFSKLDGIIGKILQEERKDSVTDKNINYFRDYKLNYPNKMVLMHFNGCARLPEFETDTWHPSWWLYKAGTNSIKWTSKYDSVIVVDDINKFSLLADSYGDTWLDLIIVNRNNDMSIDFSKYEYVRVTGIDYDNNSLILERGKYGSLSRYWPNGSYVAEIVTMGPWYAGGNKLWYYNLSINCPTNNEGLQASDAIVEGLKKHVDNELNFIDGIQLDVFYLPNSIRKSGVDVDFNSEADNGYENEVDAYSLGASDFLLKLRGALGLSRLIITDGGALQRPNLYHINGVELEGTPSSKDQGFLKWSQALETLIFYRKNSLGRLFMKDGVLNETSPFSYTMYKNKPVLLPPESFSNFRLALSLSLAAGTSFTYFDDPDHPSSTMGIRLGENNGIFPANFSIWDELVGGQLDKPGWLGRPLRKTIHIADSHNDLYNNDGVLLPKSFYSKIIHNKYGTSLIKLPALLENIPTLKFSKSILNKDIKFELPPIEVETSSVTLSMKISAMPRSDYILGMPRFAKISAYQQGVKVHSLSIPINEKLETVYLYFKRLSFGELNITIQIEKNNDIEVGRIRLLASSDCVVREYKNGIVLANPSDSPVVFNLSTLFPNQHFSRLMATENQDITINNGEFVNDEVEVPSIDALFLTKV